MCHKTRSLKAVLLQLLICQKFVDGTVSKHKTKMYINKQTHTNIHINKQTTDRQTVGNIQRADKIKKYKQDRIHHKKVHSHTMTMK